LLQEIRELTDASSTAKIQRRETKLLCFPIIPDIPILPTCIFKGALVGSS